MADVVVDTVVTPVKTFAKDSVRLINKCTKPDRKGEEETHGDDEEDRGEKGSGGGGKECVERGERQNVREIFSPGYVWW